LSEHRPDRKQLASSVLENEARFRALFENSLDGVLLTTPEGGILSVNPEAQRILGYTEEELQTLGRKGVVDTNDSRLASALAQRECTGRFKGELTLIRKDGSRIPAEISSMIFLDNDGRRMTSMVMRDLSERKRMEKEVQERRAELESLQKQQVAAETAAAFAHELNQPLSAIASYSAAALMLLDAASPDLKRIRDAVEKTEKQALRAGNSIRELLAILNLTKLETQSFELGQEITNILAIAKDEYKLQCSVAVKLETQFSLVQANCVHIRKVLLNLFQNSIEAMDEAGVTAPEIIITVQARNDQNVAMVTIKDNGPGVRKENISRIFNPFFTTKKSGIGMGLSISRSLIEVNGGQLWIDPTQGRGAIFHLTLPMNPSGKHCTEPSTVGIS
jgi:two-component system sensor kinase FixL